MKLQDVLLLLLSMRYVTTMRSKLAEPWSDSTLSTATPLDPWSARQQTMLFSSDHMVVTTTGLLTPWQYESARYQLVGATTSAGSMACFSALLFVALSRAARAESKRQSQRDPAVGGGEHPEFDSRREQGARAALSKRGLPSSRSPASAGLQHPNKFIQHNDA